MLKLILICLISVITSVYAQVKAFPSAEGYGQFAEGGRGGRTIYVTNLNDSGAGSFRSAVSDTGRRNIVFAVSGRIDLSRHIDISHPYYTIAGQTAPKDGITLIGSNLRIRDAHGIIQHIRARPGDTTLGTDCGDRDAFAINGTQANNIILDHVSASWGVDENISIWEYPYNVTISNSIIAQGLSNSCHPYGEHSKGLLIGDSTKNISVIKNYFVHNTDRNPVSKGGAYADIMNNVIYNWGVNAVNFFWDYSSDTTKVNIMFNYFKRGRSTNPNSGFITPGNPTGPVAIRIQENEGQDALLNDYNSRESYYLSAYSSQLRDTTARRVYNYNYRPARLVWKSVLDSAGATLPTRDYIDRQFVRDFYDSTGRIIDSVKQVGGYPKFTPYVPDSATIQAYDSDWDGMPNTYEIAKGLNPNSAADARIITASGYSNLELYFHYLTGDTNKYVREKYKGTMYSISRPNVTTTKWINFNQTKQTDLGIPSVRFSDQWAKRQPDSNTYDFDSLMIRLKYLKWYKADIHLVLDNSGPAWACSTGTTNTYSCVYKDTTKFKTFVNRWIDSVKPYVRYVQFGNEWHDTARYKGGMKTYSKFAKIFCAAAQADSLECVLGGVGSEAIRWAAACGGATSSFTSETGKQYRNVSPTWVLRDSCKSVGRLTYLKSLDSALRATNADVIDLHFYSDVWNWPAYINYFKARYPGKKFMASEVGVGTSIYESQNETFRGDRLKEALIALKGKGLVAVGFQSMSYDTTYSPYHRTYILKNDSTASGTYNILKNFRTYIGAQ